jgi:hypothetical protein
MTVSLERRRRAIASPARLASSAEADWREQHDQRAVRWLSPAVYAGDAVAVLGGVAGPRLADAVDEDRPHLSCWRSRL